MEIKQATIHGFGKWVDFSIDFTDKSFVCLYGENESGKSTLQRFILFMLFGFPPRQRNFYRPKTSGKMGGRLTVFNSIIGEYTIERFDEVNNGAAICYTPDGNNYDEDWLKDQLKGVTYEIYESIFSFSALDLSSFKNMKDEDLGEVLLGIGLTGSTEIYSLEKKLDNQLGELFKPYGKNPLINEQLNRLDELSASLNKYYSNEATYRTKQASVTALVHEIDRLQTELNIEKEKRLLIEKQQNVLPMIHEYQNYKSELLRFPMANNFPVNGEERLQTIKEKQLPLRSKLSILTNNMKNIKIEISQLQSQLLEQEDYKLAQEIIRKKPNYLERERKVLQYREEILKLNTQIENKLTEINIGLTMKDLSSLTFPFHIEQSWSELRNSLQRLNMEKEQHQTERLSLKKQQDALSSQLAKIKRELLTDEHVHTLRNQIKVYEQHDYQQQLLEKTTNQQKQWKKSKTSKNKQMNIIFISAINISIIIGLVAYFTEVATLYFLSSIPIIIGIGQWLSGKYSIKTIETLMPQRSIGESEQLGMTSQEKYEIDQLLLKHNQNKIDCTSISNQLKSIDVTMIKWNEKNATLTQQKVRLNELVKKAQNNYPFLYKVDTLFWPELYYTLKQLIKNEKEKLSLIQESKTDQSKIESFEQEVNRLISVMKDRFESELIDSQLQLIEESLDDHDYAQQLTKQYERELTTIKGKLSDVQQKIETYNNESVSLFEVAQVNNEEEFYLQAKQLEEQQAIEKALKKINNQLSLVFPEDIKNKLVKEKLDKSTLEMHHNQLTRTIKELGKKINEKSEELAELRVDLSNMESSGSHSKVIHQFNMELEELTKLVQEWAVIKTAKEMLTAAKRNYRNKYLKKAIIKTTQYFSTITNGAYKHVFAPEGKRPFQVQSKNDTRYTAEELSQGTIDQLYVSLRLAISEIMTEKHRMPFIIDDAFVHFDANRTKQILDLLLTISSKQQVIIFTCKKEIAQLVNANNLVRLDKNQLVS